MQTLGNGHGGSAGATSHAQAGEGHWGVLAARWLLLPVGIKAVSLLALNV